MNRKLHNSTLALIASTSLFVIGLLTSASVDQAQSPASMPVAVESVDEAPARDSALARAEGRIQRIEAAPAARHARRTHRHSLAMPFFSFAPRG